MEELGFSWADKPQFKLVSQTSWFWLKHDLPTHDIRSRWWLVMPDLYNGNADAFPPESHRSMFARVLTASEIGLIARKDDRLKKVDIGG